MKLFAQLDRPDWLWIALATALIFTLVFWWVRRREVETVAEATPNELPKKKPTKADPASTGSHSEKKRDAEPLRVNTPGELPRLEFEDDLVDPTQVGEGAAPLTSDLRPETKKIVYDEDAATEEVTSGGALILVTGIAQTDKGVRRRRNEDAILALPDHGVYVVADGMGGHRGGEVASSVAVKAIEHAFQTEQFDGRPHENMARRASELARAIQMANAAVLQRANADRDLKGMGTTVCAARFSSNKQRLYVGHVGDSRMYRLRRGKLTQLTSDHTMSDLGVKGEGATHLSRVVGVWPRVQVDIILCRPLARDLYLLCSDGLTKMLTDEHIGQILNPAIPPIMIVEALIDAANAKGGKDNISAIVIRVDDAASAGVAA